MANTNKNHELSIAELDIIFDIIGKKAVNMEAGDKNADYYWTIAFKVQQQAERLRYPAKYDRSLRKVRVA